MTASPELNEDEFAVELPEAEPHARSHADMLERLFRQFEDRLPLPVIVNVVRESREHLRGAPIGALPELTERLAYQRLTTLGLGEPCTGR